MSKLVSEKAFHAKGAKTQSAAKSKSRRVSTGDSDVWLSGSDVRSSTDDRLSKQVVNITLVISESRVRLQSCSMKLLQNINSPADLRKLKVDQLQDVAEEIRLYILETMARVGGHTGASLGAVELAVALHYAFETPHDRLVWDVGHQAYAHKILTGRRDALPTVKQYGGISGFLRRDESEYDTFGAGHASTSLSAALGMAIARDRKGEDHHVVALIGDASLAGGMAMEAVNQAGHLKTRLIVLFNDNEMSIAPAVGALTGYLNRIREAHGYHRFKDEVEETLLSIPAVGGTICITRPRL